MDYVFAVQFKGELNHEWLLEDHKENVYIVSYNMNILKPQITYGCFDLQTLYGFKGNHHILF